MQFCFEFIFCAPQETDKSLHTNAPTLEKAFSGLLGTVYTDPGSFVAASLRPCK